MHWPRDSCDREKVKCDGCSKFDRILVPDAGAKYFCEQCNENLCVGCYNAHKRVRVCREHIVTPFTRFNVSPQVVRERPRRTANNETSQENQTSTVGLWSSLKENPLKIFCQNSQNSHEIESKSNNAENIEGLWTKMKNQNNNAGSSSRIVDFEVGVISEKDDDERVCHN